MVFDRPLSSLVPHLTKSEPPPLPSPEKAPKLVRLNLRPRQSRLAAERNLKIFIQRGLVYNLTEPREYRPDIASLEDIPCILQTATRRSSTR